MRADRTALTALIPLPLREAKPGPPDGVEKNFPDPHSFLMHSSSFPYEFLALLALIRSDRTTSGGSATHRPILNLNLHAALNRAALKGGRRTDCTLQGAANCLHFG
jgi:cytosine/adenosine deaminase-related metal-dependent hydrolase